MQESVGSDIRNIQIGKSVVVKVASSASLTESSLVNAASRRAIGKRAPSEVSIDPIEEPILFDKW